MSDSIVVFGSGTVAARCVELLRANTVGTIFVFEKKQSESSILSKRLSHMSNVHYDLVSADIEGKILRIDPRIIFSINNTFIFRDALISRYTILNYHNALLPEHPGRYAEAWAIFSQDDFSGVTWHFVDNHVDTGEILLQKQIPLSTDMTSIRLLSIQSNVACNLFKEVIDLLNSGHPLPRVKQGWRKDIKFHLSHEKPNDGKLDLNWDIPQIHAFLRAMDYGKLAMLGTPELSYGGQCFVWDRYFLETASTEGVFIDLEQRECLISKRGEAIRLSGFRTIDRIGG